MSHRTLGRLEGCSFLLLLFVAMPLKYIWAWPYAVKVVGWIHGLLFMFYIGKSFALSTEESWPKRKFYEALLAAVVPFGPFLFEKKYKE